MECILEMNGWECDESRAKMYMVLQISYPAAVSTEKRSEEKRQGSIC